VSIFSSNFGTASYVGPRPTQISSNPFSKVLYHLPSPSSFSYWIMQLFVVPSFTEHVIMSALSLSTFLSFILLHLLLYGFASLVSCRTSLFLTSHCLHNRISHSFHFPLHLIYLLFMFLMHVFHHSKPAFLCQIQVFIL